MITWINEWLGTASEDTLYDSKFNYHSVIKLKDGWNTPERIYREMLSILQEHKPLVIVCHGGISRSNGIATLLLAFLTNNTWDYIYQNIVRKKVPQANVDQNFRRCCIQALELMRKRLLWNG